MNKEKNIEIAKNMLKDNVLVELISKYTGLSIEEVNKLKENINNILLGEKYEKK